MFQVSKFIFHDLFYIIDNESIEFQDRTRYVTIFSQSECAFKLEIRNRFIDVELLLFPYFQFCCSYYALFIELCESLWGLVRERQREKHTLQISSFDIKCKQRKSNSSFAKLRNLLNKFVKNANLCMCFFIWNFSCTYTRHMHPKQIKFINAAFFRRFCFFLFSCVHV